MGTNCLAKSNPIYDPLTRFSVRIYFPQLRYRDTFLAATMQFTRHYMHYTRYYMILCYIYIIILFITYHI